MSALRTRTMASFQIPPADGEGHLSGRICRPAASGHSPFCVLYMHGFGSSQDGEKAEFLSRKCLEVGVAFVSFDFQGHGRSGGSIRDLTVGRCLRDAERVRQHVEELSTMGVVLMGSSMGGLVGLWSATSLPAVAGSFVAPALGLDERFPRLIGEEGMRRWEESGILPITNEMGTFQLGWCFVEDLRSRRPESLAELHQLPSIIFQGKLDDRVSWLDIESFSDRTEELTSVVLFEDGDHRLLDKKEIIWSETRSFLSALDLLHVDSTLEAFGG